MTDATVCTCKCAPEEHGPNSWHSFAGKLQRCAEPKNHKGTCRAPRTGDWLRRKKLGIYEKDWPK